MTEPVRWGVLGVASIFERRMVPAFAAASNAHVVAVASRSLDKANEAARKHGIPAAFGSYEELLRSPDIEAVYIPLPNDLHAEWTLEALARQARFVRQAGRPFLRGRDAHGKRGPNG